MYTVFDKVASLGEKQTCIFNQSELLILINYLSHTQCVLQMMGLDMCDILNIALLRHW